MPCARRSAPVQPENAALINLPIMFLRSHDEFSAPGLLAGKSEKTWPLKRAYLLTANIAPRPIIPPFETIDPAAQQRH